MPLEIKDVFDLYNNYFKPAYSEVEAQDNEIPVEALFEIHAAFDHLKRIYINNETEDHCCAKAMGHLERATLDMYKLKLKNFNLRSEALLDLNIDFTLIDNGKFIQNLFRDRRVIISLAKEARIIESNDSKTSAYNKWYEASLAIDKFDDDYIKNSKITWGRSKTFKITAKKILLQIIGIILSIMIGALFKDELNNIGNCVFESIKSLFKF